MKTEWTIHRQTTVQNDGQRRWDMAYQCLLRWVETARKENMSNPVTPKEASNASSPVCTSLNDWTGRSTDH